MRKLSAYCLHLAVFILLAANPVFAGPAITTPVKVTQPDGTVLDVQIKGDERQNWMELKPTGHTIIKNRTTDYWEYAEPSPDGRLKPSGIKAEPGGRNAPDFIPSGQRPQKNPELEHQLMEQRALQPLQELFRAPVVSGTRNVLVILVNFSNRSFLTSPYEWSDKIFSTRPGMKSMANFYHDNSFGAITITPAPHKQLGIPPGIVIATVPDPHPDYGGNISYTADTTVGNHALAVAATYVDFASYDTNGNNVLEPEELAIYFIYAGYEAAASYKSPSAWAHAWGGGNLAAGTEAIHYWALNGELNNNDAQHPVGVVVHEMGHALFGLPDLYDTTYTNQALGNFSTMAAGSWGSDIGEEGGTTPANLDTWSRQSLGWTAPITPARGALDIPVPLSSTSGSFQLTHVPFLQSEYFLVENRQPAGWDLGLRGLIGADWPGGLLILHVDDNISSNQYVPGSHQMVVPVQANTAHCDMLGIGAICRGHATTLFYQGNNDAWSPTTTPNSNYYAGSQSGFSLTGISAPLDVMTALYHPDAIPPTITNFVVPATWDSLTVPISSLTATDNIGVTGYLVNENALAPSDSDPSWSGTAPTSYTFATPGTHTLYAWAKDAAGSVSNSRSAAVTIVGDTVPPAVTAFALPASSSTLTIAITTFTATDNVAVTGYLVSEISTKPAATAGDWSTTAPASYTFTSSGTKTLYAWAKDAAGNVSDSRSATVTVGGGVPAPWVTQDVGSVGLAGSASYLNGAFTLKGAGADVWGSEDGFRFVYQALTGNGTLTARVVSMQNTNGYAKAGVMMRQALTANSAHATMVVTPSNGAEFSRRTSTGGSTTVAGMGGVAAPYWVRLVRSGNTFTGYISTNGTAWREVGSSTISMGSTIYVGLLESSHNIYVLGTATLDMVSTQGIDTTPPVVTAFSIPASSASLTVPITTLAATDDVTVAGYLVNETASKPAASDPAWSAAKPASYTFASTGTKTLYAWAIDAAGNISDSRAATVTVSGGLPVPWGTQDIGSVGLAGNASYANGIFTVRGAGADIWGNADAFRFVYQTLTGDGTIVARVTSLQNTNGYAKAGVMFRQSLAADAVHGMMVLTPTSGAEFSRRTATGGSTTVTAAGGVAAPYWVKLVRTGNAFSGYVAAPGGAWKLVGTETIPMGSTVYVGLAVCSHNIQALTAAAIDNVEVVPGAVASPTATITSPTSGATFSAPATIPITATATPGSGATVKQVDFYAGSTLIGTSTTAPYSTTWRNVAAGTYPLTATVTDTHGNTASSTPVVVTVSALPTGWLSQDIGSVGLAGSNSYGNGVFTLLGAGADIWGTSDAFRFVYKTMTGDGQLTARVSSLQNTHGYAKGGVMIRDSLAAGSVHAMIALTPSYGAEFSRRTTAGGSTSVDGRYGVAAPYWVRLVRSGNTITGYVSSNGTTWDRVGSDTISMNSTVYVGLVVCSHNTSALATTTIDNVQ